MYVYPAMKEYLPNGDEAVQHDTEEHKELEATMKKLEAADADGSEFTRLMGELEVTLLDHIDDEESDQFPQLRQRVPHDELVKIGGKVETAKKIAPTRPHPLAPNNQVFHKLVGPGVGLVDRLRDKLTGRAKKAAGDLTDDGALRREGVLEERKGEAKEELARADERAEAKADEVADLERKTT